MQRDSLQSVTTLPILVPCKDGEAHDGTANFYEDRVLLPVRLVKDEELETISKSLRPDEQQFFRDCVALRRAYDKKDQLALSGPYERLWPYLIKAKELRPRTLPLPLAVREKLLRDTKRMATAPFDTPRAAMRSVEVYYPILVTEEIKEAHVVLWWSSRQRRFTPAIFCGLPSDEQGLHHPRLPDLKTAFFLMGLLGKIRICPLAGCEILFVPRQANIEYCSLAHQAAHRVARWRAKKRQEYQQQSGKRTPTKTKRGKSKGAR
jgi:hypothetical protein